MTTGRDVPTPPGLETLTLSSGITVGIRKVSPHTREAIGRSIPKPKPPMIEQDYGDGKTRLEPNEDDPVYLQQQQEWAERVTIKARDVFYRFGVVVDIDHEALAALRAGFEEEGIVVDSSDHLAYIKHLVIGTEEDVERIVAAITNKSQPTEEAVQDHLDTFPDPVQESPVPTVATEDGGAELQPAAGVGANTPVARDSTL